VSPARRVKNVSREGERVLKKKVSEGRREAAKTSRAGNKNKDSEMAAKPFAHFGDTAKERRGDRELTWKYASSVMKKDTKLQNVEKKRKNIRKKGPLGRLPGRTSNLEGSINIRLPQVKTS